MQAHGQMLPDLLQGYASRHRVKPGMTGWAQCNGWRGEADTMEKLLKRIEFDLYYIENWSVYLDLLTILKTVKIIVKGDVNAF
jgi:lipopolysaccharide/colanic/teichoic acid biosynthesis glycosyltransferase